MCTWAAESSDQKGKKTWFSFEVFKAIFGIFWLLYTRTLQPNFTGTSLDFRSKSFKIQKLTIFLKITENSQTLVFEFDLLLSLATLVYDIWLFLSHLYNV